VTRLSPLVFHAFVLPLLALLALAGVLIGSAPLGWLVVLHVLVIKMLPTGWSDPSSVSSAEQAIVWLIRLPRVFVAAVVGAGLATAGAMMQSLFRNPLADPGLTGVGPGAVLGAVVVFVTGWSTISVVALPFTAIISALLALVLVYAVATRAGVTPTTTLLLSGIAIGAFLTATASLLLSLNVVTWQVAQEIVFWTMGGLESRTWAHVWLSAPLVGIGLVSAWLQSGTMDVLLLGEPHAASRGVDVEGAKRILLFTAALLTGASVAVAGLIGFVGLVVPHGVRLLIGPRHRTLLPAAAPAGAAFLIACDIAARTARPPAEIRLGVVTALCGAPIFLVILLKRLRGDAR